MLILKKCESTLIYRAILDNWLRFMGRYIPSGFYIWYLAVFLLFGCATALDAGRGDRALSSGNLEQAVIYYEKALLENPEDLGLQKKLENTKNNLSANYFLKGKRAENVDNNLNAALDFYRAAFRFNTTSQELGDAIIAAMIKKEIRNKLLIAKRHVKAKRLRMAVSELDKVLTLDADNVEAKELRETLLAKLQEQEDGDEELTLASDKPITLRFSKTKLHEVIAVLSKLTSLNIILDSDVKDSSVTIYVKDATFHDALTLLLVTNKLFMKKVNDNTILIIPKNKRKAAEYEDLVVRTFYLNYMPVKEAVNLLRTLLETRKIFINTQNNSIVLRDTPVKMLLAEKVIAANDREPSEVMLDVEVLEINETDSEKFGWEFTQNFISANLDVPDGLTLDSFRGKSDKNIALSVPGILIDFLKQASKATTLAHPRIRVKNGKKAIITVGDQVPIELSTTTSQSSTAIATGGLTTATSIEFKKVGITLEVEPTIHFNNDVTLKLKIDITSLGDQVELSSGTQFKFGNRKIETELSVSDGETIVIGGLIRNDSRENQKKVPYLGDIPILGRLFTNVDESKSKTDILITITPHIIKNFELPPESVQEFWSGTEHSFDTKPMFGRWGEKKALQSAVPGESLIATAEGGDLIGVSSAQAQAGTGEALIVEEKISGKFSAVPPDESGDSRFSKIYFKPKKTGYKVGEFVSVYVELEGNELVSDLLVSVRFDKEVLSFEDAVEGDMLSADRWPTAFISSGNPELGMLNVRTYRIKDSKGIKTAGRLCTLKFKAIGEGTSLITFDRVDLFDSSKNILQVDVENASITVK